MGIETSEEKLYKVFKSVLGEDSKERNPKKMKINYTEFIKAAIDLNSVLN